MAKKYGNLFLVTTPDLLQYILEGHHLPFTRDLVDYNQISSFPKKDGIIRIVHATNHDGIEGTRYIEEAVAKLKSEGYPVELLIVRKIPHEKALQIYKSADICVGKTDDGVLCKLSIREHVPWQTDALLYSGRPQKVRIRLPDFKTRLPKMFMRT